MTPTEVILPTVLGVVGALWHLQLTHTRATIVSQGHLGLALALLPVSLAGPALTVLAASRMSAPCAWLAAATLVLTHRLLLIASQFTRWSSK